MNRFEDLLALCQGKHIYIQMHNFPDPDAIASGFGLQRLLEEYGVSSTLCYAGLIDKLSTEKMLKILNIRAFAQDDLEMSPEDPIICIDSQKDGGNITDFVGDEIACIDHHPTVTPVEYAYKDVRFVGACATIVAGYYADMGKQPDPDTATALLYGLKMDTLQFARGVTWEDIGAFQFLFPICD